MTVEASMLIDETKLHPRLVEAVGAMRADGLDEIAIARALRAAKTAVIRNRLPRNVSPEVRAAAAERMRMLSKNPVIVAKRTATKLARFERVKRTLALLDAQEKYNSVPPVAKAS